MLFVRGPVGSLEGEGSGGRSERAQLAEAQLLALHARCADLTEQLARAQSDSQPLSASSQVYSKLVPPYTVSPHIAAQAALSPLCLVFGSNCSRSYISVK